MAQNYEKLLLNVGFLPSEVKVYIASLELGSTSVQNIAKKANVSRTAAYEAIEGLQKRGLISSTLRGKRRVYAAEDPERIVSYLKEEQQRFETTLTSIQRSVEAMKLMAGGIKPSVKSYEGEEALHAYFQHIAEVKPKVFDEISNLDDVYAHLTEENLLSARKSYAWPKFDRIRLLYQGKLRNPRKGVEFRKLSETWGAFHGNIAIYEKYIAFATYVGKAAVVIVESKTLADTMRMMYEIAWASGTPKKIS